MSAAAKGWENAPELVDRGEPAVCGEQGGAPARVVPWRNQRQSEGGVGAHDCGDRRARRRGEATGIVSSRPHATAGRGGHLAGATERIELGKSAPMGRVLAGRSTLAATAVGHVFRGAAAGEP